MKEKFVRHIKILAIFIFIIGVVAACSPAKEEIADGYYFLIYSEDGAETTTFLQNEWPAFKSASVSEGKFDIEGNFPKEGGGYYGYKKRQFPVAENCLIMDDYSGTELSEDEFNSSFSSGKAKVLGISLEKGVITSVGVVSSIMN